MIQTAIRALSRASAAFAIATLSVAHAQGVLEVPAPASVQSGIGAISGWHCTAASIAISIDGGPPLPAGTHTSRNDTLGVCGRADTGFSLLLNWNTLPTQCFGCRFHRAVALADAVPFADIEFQAENFRYRVPDGQVGRLRSAQFSRDRQHRDVALGRIPAEFLGRGREEPVQRGRHYYGALQTGAQNPARTFPPKPRTGDPHAQVRRERRQQPVVARGAVRRRRIVSLPAIAFEAPTGPNSDGYLHARYDAAATAACAELPQGLDVRVNGRRLDAHSLDNCRTARDCCSAVNIGGATASPPARSRSGDDFAQPRALGRDERVELFRRAARPTRRPCAGCVRGRRGD
ncbi:MAG: hypothetical protein IPM02_23505 [Betaproteobacteria bacterium]|nr:hypothetical protein [Betaproteobacteria bacterium]